MLKYLFTLPLIFASAALTSVEPSALDNEAFDVEMRSHHHSHSHSHRPVTVPCLSTTFTLTPVGNTGYTLTATPASNGFFSIASNGAISLPRSGDYTVQFNLQFATTQPLQDQQLEVLFNGIGFIELIDESNQAFLGTIFDFNGNSLVSAAGPIFPASFFQNLGSATLVPLSGVLTVCPNAPVQIRR